MDVKLPVGYEVNLSVLPEILLYSFLFLGLFYLLYRRYIVSFLDPLFLFVFTTAFSCVLVIKTVPTTAGILHFFGCQAFVFAGFALVQERFRPTLQPVGTDPSAGRSGSDVLTLTCYLLLALYILANLVLLFTKGFPLLSDRPTSAKIAFFQGGFGVIRKINWGAGGFLTAGLLYLYFIRRERKFLFFLLIVAVLTALEGSKASLLRIIFSFALLAYHPILKQQAAILLALKRYLPMGLAAVGVVFATVMLKETLSTEEAVFRVLKRLLYSGDVVMYYYHPINQQYFTRYSIADYPAYLFDPILGFLRLAPYMEMFGNVMIRNLAPPMTKTKDIIGPNTPFYIEGLIFFGYYGAFLHSFIVGAVFSAVRRWYFSLRNPSAFKLAFLCYICQVATFIVTDTKLVLAVAFDTCFFVLPTYGIAYFILNRKQQPGRNPAVS